MTPWLSKHPGGARLLLHYGGEDATIAWTSFHNNTALVRKYMAAYHIGHLVEEQRELAAIDKDFLKFRSDMEAKGYFKVNPWFFVALFAHILFFQVAAWWVLWYFGNSWITWIISAVCVITAQAQAGWLQHDFGHHTVFNSTRLNHIFHDISIGLMKGVSSFWWNYRHFQHHAKPNVFLKDPDITIPYVLLLGKIIPEKWGKKHWGRLPYHLQHRYFYFIGPPLLLPVYFHVEVVYYTLKKRKWKDLACMLFFYYCFHLMYASLLGGFWASFRWYFFIRFLESHWFVWCTQTNHIPMNIDLDKRKDWVSMQLAGTCDVEKSLFNDWFTGHLNYQIEHHLFPTMPRHNFSSVRPHVIEFCQKHNIEFVVKPFWQACADIISSLKESGEIWLEAWNIHIEPESKTK